MDPDGRDAIFLGGSFSTWLTGGFEIGALVTYPGVKKENFDIGIYGTAEPGGLPSLIAEQINPQVGEIEKGIDIGRTTINAGVDFNGRDGFKGKDIL